MKYLKQFVVGSSLLITFPFLIGFLKLKSKNGDYVTYSYLLPIYFGLANILSFILAEMFNLSYNQRFLLITFISLLVTIFFNNYLNIYKRLYNFSKNEWIQYYLLIIVCYFIVWNVIIKNIELSI